MQIKRFVAATLTAAALGMAVIPLARADINQNASTAVAFGDWRPDRDTAADQNASTVVAFWHGWGRWHHHWWWRHHWWG
jgi:hypothetical protein